MGGLVFGAWKLTRLGIFRADAAAAYWIGVAGGIAFLVLFSYPLRKHVRALHGLGKIKWWFRVHMALGIVGPLLILLHSRFHVGSMNAAVALYCMLVVAASGLIGRFFYLRVYRDLSGEQTNLRQLQAEAGQDRSEARSKLHFAPAVEDRLQQFADNELNAKPGWSTYFRQLLVLPVQRWFVYRACVADLRAPLADIARKRRWRRAEHELQQRLARKLIRHYLKSVARVAQFSAYERIFALWHVAHVPFVVLFVISAVIHVVAVHAY
ncbi:MAG: hypothetical protein WA210_15570 [Burkholderiaceae bacterium]